MVVHDILAIDLSSFSHIRVILLVAEILCQYFENLAPWAVRVKQADALEEEVKHVIINQQTFLGLVESNICLAHDFACDFWFVHDLLHQCIIHWPYIIRIIISLQDGVQNRVAKVEWWCLLALFGELSQEFVALLFFEIISEVLTHEDQQLQNLDWVLPDLKIVDLNQIHDEIERIELQELSQKWIPGYQVPWLWRWKLWSSWWSWLWYDDVNEYDRQDINRYLHGRLKLWIVLPLHQGEVLVHYEIKYCLQFAQCLCWFALVFLLFWWILDLLHENFE